MSSHLQVGDERAAERRAWDLTFEHSPVGMAIVALDGSWRRVNQSLCRMLGYQPEVLFEMTFQDITHPDDLGRDLDLLGECLDGSREGYRMVKRYRHADGRLVWGDLSVALVRDALGPVHFVSQILDVSDQRADRERLEAMADDLTLANADLAQFATVVSHDLKTPLTSLRASLELLADALPDESTSTQSPGGSPRALASRAEAAAERMSALIDALLAYTTTDPRLRGSERWYVGPQPTRLCEVVEAALEDVTVIVERSATSIHLEPGLAVAPDVLASPALVRTLVVNLVSNAVKYRHPDQQLRVRIDAAPEPGDDQMLRVTIGNDGPPIPAEDRERLFTLFSRGHRAGSDAGRDDVPGFGIGLAACRRIVSWHGGQIWFAEPRDHLGVLVCFTLPIAP